MKKIILFGATGNVGMYFADYCAKNLDKNQFELVATGRKNTDWFERHNITYMQVDLRCEEDFKKLPDKDVYAIVNMAGILPAYLKEYDPYKYIDTNVTGGVRVLEYARRVGADRTLYMQTWAEMAGYWGKEEVLSPKMTRKLCFTGDHAFYAITKSMVVDAMEHYHQEFGIKNFVFRLPNIYLYNPERYYYVDGVAKPIAYRYMIDKAIRGENIELWGNPDAFKDIVYVKDFCQMVYKALFAQVDGGTYNVGTGQRTTLREQIEGMISVFSPKDHPSKIIELPEKPTFTSFVMDIENAKADLGYLPKYDYIAYLEDYKLEMNSNRFCGLWQDQTKH